MNIEDLILNVVYFINCLVPKNKNQVFFYSFPDYDDNARAIYERLRQMDVNKKYKVVWAVREVEKYEKYLPDDVVVVKHRSLKNLWYFMRSKYLFRTHSLWGNKYVSGRQKMCIAWHGMPIKREYDPKKEIKKVGCDLLNSTASFFHNELCSAMGIDLCKCKVTGLPRNDQLFIKSDILKKLGYDGYKKILVWMPTFRTSSFRNDGKESVFGLPTVPEDGLDKLNEILRNKSYLLVLKLHPFAADKISGFTYSNIKSLRNEDIPQEHTLYEFIGHTDALITDYSSISVDYLLTDKPMCFVIDDIEEYRSTRGFAYEPIEDYLIGDKIYTFEELCAWFTQFDGSDTYTEKRADIRSLFHEYADGISSERLLREFGLV